MGTNSLIRIVLSLVVIAGFFMPLQSGGVSLWDLVRSMPPDTNTKLKLFTYAYLLVPFCALIVLILAAVNRPVSGLLCAIPFVVFVIVTAYFIRHFGEKISMAWFKAQGLGFYILFIASLLLMLLGGSRRRAV